MSPLPLSIPREERRYAVLDHYAAAPHEWEPVVVLAMPPMPDDDTCIAVATRDGVRKAVAHARVINYVDADEIPTGEGFRLLAEGVSLAGEDRERAWRLAGSALESLVDFDAEMEGVA